MTEKYAVKIEGYTLELARKSIELDDKLKSLAHDDKSNEEYLKIAEEKDRNDKYLGHWIAQDLKNCPF